MTSRRRLSIDQLTEEAEADLANNNDPNNNSSNNEENQIDQHLQHEQQQQQQQQQQQLQEQQSMMQRRPLRIYSDDESDDEDDVNPQYPVVDLEPDINLILKLMPDKTYDEVRYMLEAHQNDASRVQVSI